VVSLSYPQHLPPVPQSQLQAQPSPDGSPSKVMAPAGHFLAQKSWPVPQQSSGLFTSALSEAIWYTLLQQTSTHRPQPVQRAGSMMG